MTLPASAAALPISGSQGGERRPKNLMALALILTVGAVLRFAFSVSISGNDDLSVASCALDMLDAGLTVPQGHYCARFGMIFPLAGIFGLFGTGATQISLLPALASLANMLLAWRLGLLLFGPSVGASVGLAAAAVMALHPMSIEFAGLAFPDALQGALLGGALLAVLQASRISVHWLPLSVLGGVLWAWAHYVKLDSGLFAVVLGLAWLTGFARLRDVVVAGLVALLLVGIELTLYGLFAGDALLRVHLESTAANEMLAAGHDYRNWLIYPKAMLLVPYSTGLFYFLWIGGIGAALWTRHRGALLLAGWSVIWMLWLFFGADPFSELRLKPQLPRYLLSFAVPVAVLGGWMLVLLWRRSRILCSAISMAGVAATLVFAPFTMLGYEAGLATRLGIAEALRNNWFPLCPDAQSSSVARFLLFGRPQESRLCVVQQHDFLTGVTTLLPPETSPSWLLLNENYARQLERRSLVRRVDPAGFGFRPALVWQVDNPMPDLSYRALDLLAAAAALMPLDSIRAGIAATRKDIGEGADARIWRVERPGAGR